ncbi:hypothetical protein F5144DRAFT_215280 [Chaetomium tenue]|uniref:Uncharacterized protein n=1 Tax=Chaetomium tenue TaxID=1854479 RepID=A0ACB7P932_9PEZI|nr:hypothetical protein F5144DRAFT_215280 [Chaetomium globosum]
MPSATPQPQLKKKASFRDRLKAWQKPLQPLEIVTEELKPRFVYEPTHAAADFSRLAVSPLSPTKPRLPPAATYTAPEKDSSTAVRNKQPLPVYRDEVRDDEPTRRHSRSSVNRHSYTLVEDPFQASNAAAHVPVNPRPVAWSPGEPASSTRAEPPPPPPAQPLSDFELFLARAEAEDREKREQLLRSISQRSTAYAANRVRPDPHRQFAAVVPSTTEKTAKRPVEKGERPAQYNSKTRHALVPRASTEAEQQQPQNRQQRQDSGRKGHARKSSWAASYTTGSSAGEKGPVILPPKRQARPLPEPPQPARAAGAGEEYQPQPPRTLRRQASLMQRLVQYIRPPKTGSRPIETLVE